MLTSQQMQGLKKVNISKDAQKTKERISEDFKSASKEDKNAIVTVSGLKRTSFYRVFDTGNATAKIILSMAQTLGASPYYYIGAEDEKGEFSLDLLRQFLQELGYGKLAKSLKRARKPRKQSNKAPTQEVGTSAEATVEDVAVEPSCAGASPLSVVADDANATVTISVNFEESDKVRDAVQNLDEEDAILLLKALSKRAKANQKAETLFDLVKRCLLS